MRQTVIGVSISLILALAVACGEDDNIEIVPAGGADGGGGLESGAPDGGLSGEGGRVGERDDAGTPDDAGPAEPGGPTVAFELDVRDLSLSVDDAGSIGGASALASYAWDFGDGGTATSATPRVHVYPANGPEAGRAFSVGASPRRTGQRGSRLLGQTVQKKRPLTGNQSAHRPF